MVANAMVSFTVREECHQPGAEERFFCNIVEMLRDSSQNFVSLVPRNKCSPRFFFFFDMGTVFSYLLSWEGNNTPSEMKSASSQYKSTERKMCEGSKLLSLYKEENLAFMFPE